MEPTGTKHPSPSDDPIDILVVDDQVIIGHALQNLLSGEPGFRVETCAGDSEEALRTIGATHPRLVLLDLTFKTGRGLELTRHIRTAYPDTPVLILSAHDETLFAERALRAGARGYMMKQESVETLLTALEVVLGGGIFITKPMRQRILHRVSGQEEGLVSNEFEGLSDRELEVYQHIGQGYSTQQIAEMLKLSVKTVETHRSRIKKKLDLPNNTVLINHAAQWALQGKHT